MSGLLRGSGALRVHQNCLLIIREHSQPILCRLLSHTHHLCSAIIEAESRVRVDLARGANGVQQHRVSLRVASQRVLQILLTLLYVVCSAKILIVEVVIVVVVRSSGQAATVLHGGGH